jgi:mannose-1-phosphate guanylyltransferase/mannose-6-phosphate isomerase
VILCGGSGTRLWPASREKHPKQFLTLFGDFSLLQNTLRRAMRVSGAKASSVVVVTLCGMEQTLRDQLSEINEDAASHVLCEPSARNTAAAVALAADYVAKTFGENAVMWILPADHHIGREAELSVSFHHALQAAKDGKLATFGINPTRPDTGYGYIHASKADENGVMHIDNFVEKPDAEAAESYLADGNYLWNSGMFVFAAKTVLSKFKEYAPAILDNVRRSVKNAPQRPESSIYDAIESVPFDTAIMENAKDSVVVPTNPEWSDIGTWESYWDISEKDKNGNVLEGRAVAHNAEGCLVKAKDRLITVTGLKDIVIIETDDALLVTNKSNSDLKDLVVALQKSGAPEAFDIAKPAPAQPWTMVKQLDEEKSLGAREVMLKPGQHKVFDSNVSGLCLYTVIEGKADIMVNGALHTIKAFESLNIETKTDYTITNHGAFPLKMIEVRKTAAEGVFFGKADNARKVA